MLDIPLYLHPFAVKEWNFHLNILFFFPSAQHTRSRHEWDLLSRFYTDDIGVRVDFSYPSTILIHLALARCPQPNFFAIWLCQNFISSMRLATRSVRFKISSFFNSVSRLDGWSVACTTVRACGAFATTRPLSSMAYRSSAPLLGHSTLVCSAFTRRSFLGIWAA